MKKISIILLVLVAALASCKKTPEVNLKYVDVERDLVTVGMTTANIQCDYEYITTLKKAYLYYGEGEDEIDMASAEMRVVQKTLYVELAGLKDNTTYHYYYEFVNSFNSMRSALKTFKTEASPTSLATVITAAVTEITTNSAKGGGEVTNDGGAEVTERGVCWSKNANPTLNDSHLAAGTGTGAFTAVMSGLQANTTYHVRAYAVNEKGTAYGLDKEFTTPVFVPEGAINGLFTINANGDQVYFSQGNLQYIGSAATPYWKFAENQWDYLGETTGQNSANQNVDRDLFGWGTSGWNNGNLYYQPYDCDFLDTGNAGDYGYGYGPTDGTNYYYDLTGQYANADWGVYNAILNGGNLPNQWRTLTYDEWEHVINDRDVTSGFRYVKAVVNNVNGIVLLPDDWNSSFYTLNYPNRPDIPFSANLIDVEAWNMLEVNGCVFLPAAGGRYGINASEFNIYGYYRSSTSSYNIGLSSYGLRFCNNEFINRENSNRESGLSVRLVQDANFQPSIQAPTVITSDVSNITSNSAICCGQVTNDGGATITELGICWSTNANPTLDDSHDAVAVGTGIGAYYVSMTNLEANTTYHVRFYAINAAGTSYGQVIEFTTLSNGGSGEHEYVDLGLPSGTLWATCNVGANVPEEYGDYIAWGEITPKTTYSWSNYQYCNGDEYTLTKYCDDSSYGYSGFTDDLTTLLPEDDAVTANWGNGWRMPTDAEWMELYQNTTRTWTTQNGVNGYLFTASNGNSLFLPAAGQRWVDELYFAGSRGLYWSSSLGTIYPNLAWFFMFYSGNFEMGHDYRCCGQSVRPVRSAL